MESSRDNSVRAELVLGVPTKGWYTRGTLPHYDSTRVMQFITFRLADSLPADALRDIEEELRAAEEDARHSLRRQRIEEWLDAGHGCCALGHPDVAMVVKESLCRFAPERYRLIAWCIMPNHVHVLIQPHVSLPRIVQSWKSYSGRWAMARNAELDLGILSSQFWMREYWDRYIRDERHFDESSNTFTTIL